MDSFNVNSNDDRRIRVQITEEQLLCKKKCGFYGTPQWKGLCSSCWRQYQLEDKKAKDYAKNRKLLGQEYAEKRNADHKAAAAIKSLVGLPKSASLSLFSPAADTSSSSGLHYASSAGVRPPSPDSLSASRSFQQYLADNFVPSIACDIEKQCRAFMEKLFRSEDLAMDDLSEMVQSLYRSMNDRFARLNISTDDKKVVDFMAALEKFVCNRAYSILFCTRTDEEAADLSLQERIRSLHWVTYGFLETALDLSSNKVQDYLDEAVTQIVDLNSHRSIPVKLDCLIKCSEAIFHSLKESREGAPASADEFLPVLIYVILKANPPLIQSNLKFISRFGLPYRIMRGQSGYYFTNLMCAIEFISRMNAEDLHLNNEDFDAYTKGLRIAPTKNSVSNSVLKSMESSLKRLEEIADSRKKLNERMDQMEKKFEEDTALFKQSVETFKDECPSKEVKHILHNLHISDETGTPEENPEKVELTSSGSSQGTQDDQHGVSQASLNK
ncbi:vacuolar sorting protein 9 (VPS9) domain-containing protein [Ditylenchus destructor]|nr:vacuolar sorting protein 9 (VPS9) domain-containing protein [Ditylenchus destructor]